MNPNPDLDPNPDPSCSSMDLRIVIRTKMSRIHKTVTHATISTLLMGTVNISEFEASNLTTGVERRTTVTSVGAGMRGGPLFADLNTNNREARL